MSRREFRLLNVFTDGSRAFTGNPLAVLPEAAGLTDGQMQDVARQFNLSETTFVTTPGPEGTSASVRIFTPSYELPFAGHPTLGTAYVVRELTRGGGQLVLRMPAGDIPVAVEGDRWVLTRTEATIAPAPVEAADLAATVGVSPDALGDPALFVDTGVRQLILPLRTVDDVRAARADPVLLRRHTASVGAEALVYVWAEAGEREVEARLFFTQGGGVAEDPATGSACANLGGWFRESGRRGRWLVRQGREVLRPSVLHLEVDETGAIRVGGEVREVGRGVLEI